MRNQANATLRSKAFGCRSSSLTASQTVLLGPTLPNIAQDLLIWSEDRFDRELCNNSGDQFYRELNSIQRRRTFAGASKDALFCEKESVPHHPLKLLENKFQVRQQKSLVSLLFGRTNKSGQPNCLANLVCGASRCCRFPLQQSKQIICNI